MYDSDCIIVMGSNMAENHPVAFRWPMKAKVEQGGYRISAKAARRHDRGGTRSKDDSAGLAVAESLKAQSKILQQGTRNLSDGISLLSIADSAVENLSEIVLRLEELAAQTADAMRFVITDCSLCRSLSGRGADREMLVQAERP